MHRLRITLLAALTVMSTMAFSAVVWAQPTPPPDKTPEASPPPSDTVKPNAPGNPPGDQPSPDGQKPVDKKPTAEDIEKAKEAFMEGNRLFEAKDFTNAVQKFKEAYRLSKNPLLLYNIGFTHDELNEIDLALFYYEKFLKDATPNAQVYEEVKTRVEALKKAKEANSVFDSGHMKTSRTEDKPQVTEFMHKVVEETPPGKPLDITAFIPEGSGWQVSLYFRAEGDSKFESTIMRPRYNEIVGRIPAAKTLGKTLQYYIEVRDKSGTVVERSGRSTSPNLVFIDAKAQPRYYPDLTDEREWEGMQGSGGGLVAAGQDSSGGIDVKTTRFQYIKWGTTAGAVAMLGLAVTFNLQAARYSTSLEADAALSASECGSPPCRAFSKFQKDVQSTGERYDILTTVSVALGVATASVAGYMWYKELSDKREAKQPAAGSSTTGITAMPIISDELVGGAARLTF